MKRRPLLFHLISRLSERTARIVPTPLAFADWPCVKHRRMPFIAANGLIVLVPAALVLAAKARAGEFDGAFYAVQAVELIAGAATITLLGPSMRDGLRMTGRCRGPGSARPRSQSLETP